MCGSGNRERRDSNPPVAGSRLAMRSDVSGHDRAYAWRNHRRNLASHRAYESETAHRRERISLVHAPCRRKHRAAGCSYIVHEHDPIGGRRDHIHFHRLVVLLERGALPRPALPYYASVVLRAVPRRRRPTAPRPRGSRAPRRSPRSRHRSPGRRQPAGAMRSSALPSSLSAIGPVRRLEVPPQVPPTPQVCGVAEHRTLGNRW